MDDSKSWSGSELPCSDDDCLLFNSSIIISLGDGAKTKFWHHNWLDGQAPRYLAPNLFRLVSRTNRTVQQELRNNNWMHKLGRKITSTIHIEEFVSLWIRIQDVHLQWGVHDTSHSVGPMMGIIPPARPTESNSEVRSSPSVRT